MATTRVLGIDPGKRQTWYALILFTSHQNYDLYHTEVVDTGHIDLYPDDPLNERMPLVREAVEHIYLKTKPDLVCAERYIVRPGKGQGNVSEIVNLFLGLVYSEMFGREVPCDLLMPSQHKTWSKANMLRDPGWRWGLNAHESDAATLAIYGAVKRSL